MGLSYTTEIEVHAENGVVIAAGSILWHEESEPGKALDIIEVSLYPNGEIYSISKLALDGMAPGPYTDPPETEPAIHTGPDS